RMSIFETAAELTEYLAVYDQYHTLLEEEVGIHLPVQGYVALENDDDRPIFYIIQQKIAAAALANKAVGNLSPDEADRFFTQVLRQFQKVWTFNQAQDQFQVGLDGQISNWAIADFDPEQPDINPDTKLLYVDTSTPLFRVNGVEQLDSELFLRSAPSFLRWLLRWLFLSDVVNRYYDLHLVSNDLLANLYKEQMPHLIPDFIVTATRFFTHEMAGHNISPLSEDAVRDYYREDKRIWAIYAAMRRLDRTLQTRLLRRPYPYILPGKVQR
ncbi:MAG: hypothetical protein GY796_02770, partial [Chloroflexi bacterium]|nr:hypothetical protein [Chloroflexota bacterium]